VVAAAVANPGSDARTTRYELTCDRRCLFTTKGELVIHFGQRWAPWRRRDAWASGDEGSLHPRGVDEGNLHPELARHAGCPWWTWCGRRRSPSTTARAQVRFLIASPTPRLGPWMCPCSPDRPCWQATTAW